jgi:hypothetical protein
MRKWALLMLIPLLSGCSANWHLKRAIAKNPELLKASTVVVHDTVVVPPMIVSDTVFMPQSDSSVVWENDSLRIEFTKVKDASGKDRLVFKTQIKERLVPYAVEVECPPVVEYRPTPYPKYKDYILYILAVALAILSILYKFRR